MAAISTIVAVASLAIGTVSLVAGEQARGRAQNEQKKIQGEQKAQNAAQAAAAKRTQIREERVRRARILQSSEDTGTAGSSGELGAVGGMATNLATNLGSDAGRFAAGNRISDFAQNAANDMFDAQQADKLFSLSTSIFSASGGFSNFTGGVEAPKMTEATRTGRLPGTS